ncbi:MAG: HEAT repeat domain-containing protein [Planctomycetota bacterium]
MRGLTMAATVGLLLIGGCASTEPAPTTQAAETARPLAVEQSEWRERAISELVMLARDPTPIVRANALEALSLAPARLESQVAAGLADQNEGVRAIAAMLVGRERLGGLVEATRPLMNDPSPYVRVSAVASLRRLGEPVDPTPIAEMLLGDPSPRVRAHAARALGDLGDASALPLLADAYSLDPPLATPNEAAVMRLQIAESMIRLGDRTKLEGVRAALFPSRPEDLELAALAVQIIGEVEDRASAGQVIQLSTYREGGRPMPAEVRLECATTAAKLGYRDGGFIAEEFTTSEVAVLRVQAATAWGWIGGETGLSRCRTLLGDPDPRVRAAAAAGVIRIASRGI